MSFLKGPWHDTVSKQPPLLNNKHNAEFHTATPFNSDIVDVPILIQSKKHTGKV